MTAFAANLRRLQSEHDLTNRALAEWLGVSTVTVQHWRSGRWLCKVPQALALARLFHTPPARAPHQAHRPHAQHRRGTVAGILVTRFALARARAVRYRAVMPAQVADWSEVKATAIGTGSLKQAAQAHGIEYGAVRVRAHREQWPVGRRVHAQAKAAVTSANEQIVRASEGRVTSVTSAPDALAEINADHSRRGRAALLRYGAEKAEHAASLPDAEGLIVAPLVASLARTLATAGDWQAGVAVGVQINLGRLDVG